MDAVIRMNRRTVFRRLWIAAGVVALGEAAAIVWSFVRPRPAPTPDSTSFVAGPVDRFDRGGVTAFPDQRFYLVRLPDGGVMALHRACPHLGCTVAWDPTRQQFVCPCHASVFDIRGEVLAAPSPRPLDYLPVRVENGLVRVELARRLTRETFEGSQVAQP